MSQTKIDKKPAPAIDRTEVKKLNEVKEKALKSNQIVKK